MDLPPGIIDFIDQYVSEALDATGTRKQREQQARLPSVIVDLEEDTLIPIHIDFEDHTSPDAQNQFAEEEGTAWMAPALRPEVEIDPLPRIRAPRSSASPIPMPKEPKPIFEVDEDDEVTNVVDKPTA